MTPSTERSINVGKTKYKWKISPPPAGRYKSFEKRLWPTAEYPNGMIQAFISCEDQYDPTRNRTGKHKPLTLMVYNYTDGPRKRKTMRITTSYPTIDDCKIKLEELMAQFPTWAPEEYR